MGWFDGVSEVGSSSSRHHHHHKSSSGKHHSSDKERGSIFGSGSPKHNRSTSSFFGWAAASAGGRSSSYYKRSPREGYMKRVYQKLRRLLRDLIHYMKKNPMKVFVLVIMPLITGGALTGLLAKFGIRLPGGLEKMFGGAAGGGGMGIGRGAGGQMQFERSRVEGHGPLGGLGAAVSGLGGLGSAVGGMGGIGGAVSLAKMFM